MYSDLNFGILKNRLFIRNYLNIGDTVHQMQHKETEMKKTRIRILSAIFIITIILSSCAHPPIPTPTAPLSFSHEPETRTGTKVFFSSRDAEPYSGQPYATINGNVPYFTEEELTTDSFELYSELDELGRCGPAYACVGLDLMPAEERGEIGNIKPSGWHTVKYNDIVDGNYLYNRCHLIGYLLSGENANEKNLITGTRYLNVQGMLPFETEVAEYVTETWNHVLYRVTPIFQGDNLLASGVLMEAESVEDRGQGVSFCVYVYNVQPGIAIDYATGESAVAPDAHVPDSAAEVSYILNTNTRKFHFPSCSSVKQMKEKNRQEYTGTRDEVTSMGYEPCQNCNP